MVSDHDGLQREDSAVNIVIILVVLLVLAGGGLFGAITFAPDVVPEPVRAMLGVEVDESAEPAEPVRPENTTLIELDPITIPIIEDGDVDRFLVLHILLEVEFGEKQAYVSQQMPRIIDALITHIHALAALDIAPGISDRQFLKERLVAHIAETIGEGYVIDILFQNLFERPLG
jgi:flagellar basal body-associated protein FliL